MNIINADVKIKLVYLILGEGKNTFNKFLCQNGTDKN